MRKIFADVTWNSNANLNKWREINKPAFFEEDPKIFELKWTLFISTAKLSSWGRNWTAPGLKFNICLEDQDLPSG